MCVTGVDGIQTGKAETLQTRHLCHHAEVLECCKHTHTHTHTPTLSLPQKAEERPSFSMIFPELKHMSNENDRDYSELVDEG